MKSLKLVICSVMFWSAGSTAIACNHCMGGDHMKQMKDMTDEQRTKMADMHTKMGDCLKNKEANPDPQTCFADMEKSCPFHDGKDGQTCEHHKDHNKANKKK